MASTIDHPAIYTEVGKEHCEGRYGGLFTAGGDVLASVAGFEVGRTKSMLLEDALTVRWHSVEGADIRVAGVYMQPRLFYRMDAIPSNQNKYIWRLDRLRETLGAHISFERVAISITASSKASTEIQFLPAILSPNNPADDYRISLEILHSVNDFSWRVSRKGNTNSVFDGKAKQNVSRNQFVDLILPMESLTETGEYLLELSGSLRNEAIAVQYIFFKHTAS